MLYTINYIVILQSAPVCDGELTALVDLDTGDNLIMKVTGFEFLRNTVNMTAQLTVNHRYNVTFVAGNGGINSVTISKYYNIGVLSSSSIIIIVQVHTT